MFYTKIINVIMDSIGPSIILRSIQWTILIVFNFMENSIGQKRFNVIALDEKMTYYNVFQPN